MSMQKATDEQEDISQHFKQQKKIKKRIAEDGFDPSTSGLWAQHAPAAPLCCATQLEHFHQDQKLLEIEKEIAREVALGDKHRLRKSADRKAQIDYQFGERKKKTPAPS